ncbi:MAG TPA: histidine--tRNA ligase [Verrucomicrobiae bacterium]|nr:histidine--tRNA ligase [Verrucomicrobiae bacterium]
MATIQSPRGTRDILPADQAAWTHVTRAAAKVAAQMGFQPITIPTYENRELFQRSIGEGTDVMDKELFLVRGIETEPGKEEYALRPEGTAGIVRSFIEHGMHTWPQPVKLWSFVNCFRYDRPQKGRYREHTQLDVEFFGDATPFADAWVLLTMWQFYKEVGLGDRVELKINTLGTPEERAAYVDTLREYFMPFRDQLSEDSQKRLDKNPLRILDSKNEGDRRLCDAAPRLKDNLGEASKAHYAEVLRQLGMWGIPIVEDPFLVRGLDYYSHTTFEWVPTGIEGQQASVGGGGRYDGLVSKLGGPATGAIGFGIGLDRICELVVDSGVALPEMPKPDYFLVAADAAGRGYLEREVLPKLLAEGKSVDAALGKEGVGAQLKQAGKVRAKQAIIVGEQEVEKGEVVVKDMASGEQTTQKL